MTLSRIARPVVFPLLPLTADGSCTCIQGAACTRAGKHAAVAWGSVTLDNPAHRPAPGAGYGVRTGAAPEGSGIVVVDLDSEAAADAWEAMGGHFDTFTVSTPRGFHVYFNHPGFPVGNSAGQLAKGVDIRGDGGFVVGPGSPHKSGGLYSVGNDLPLAEVPDCLLQWLKSRPQQKEIAHYSGDVEPGTPEHAYRRRLYSEYLTSEAEVCTQGEGGDPVLFRVVQRGAYDLGLPTADVLELIAEHYDPRCNPPWGDELEARVIHKAHDAKTKSTREAMIPWPEDIAATLKPREDIQQGFTSVLGNIEKNSTIPESLVKVSPLGEIWGGWDQPVLPPVYLLDGMIPEATVFAFFAEGGSLKTWAALSLAIAVATGEPWLGKYPVKQGKVLYVDYEDARYEFTRRVRLLTGGREIPDLGYLYGGPELTNIELWRGLGTLDLQLIMVDSLGAGMPATADENTTAFAAAIKMAGKYSTASGATIGFVHHANKSGTMRGSSAVRDQCDVVFAFEPISETDTSQRRRMVCNKPGPQRKPKPVNLELSDEGLHSFDDEVHDAARNAQGGTDLKSAIKLALANGPLVVHELCERLGTRNNKGVRESLKALAELGEVRNGGKFEGWQLDDDGKRFARILAAAPDSTGSTSRLAEDADVPTEYVDRARRARLIDFRIGREGGGFTVRQGAGK